MYQQQQKNKNKMGVKTKQNNTAARILFLQKEKMR
jgi:hypothetical protein